MICFFKREEKNLLSGSDRRAVKAGLLSRQAQPAVKFYIYLTNKRFIKLVLSFFYNLYFFRRKGIDPFCRVYTLYPPLAGYGSGEVIT